MARSSIVSLLKAYKAPLVLFALGIIFQFLVVSFSSPPPSHYSVLGLKTHSSIDQVREAYEKISSTWSSGTETPVVDDFIKVRYAFELLSNPLWKRDYDLFLVDEHLHVMEKLQEQYAGESFSSVHLPLLDASSEFTHQGFNVINTENFRDMGTGARLLQLYSKGSKNCANFSNTWKRIVGFLDGVATTDMVEVGEEAQLAAYLADRKSTGQAFFRNGLPSLVAFPPDCTSSDCLVRYRGDLTVDGVTDWFATEVLGLPRILYYSKESLGPNFIAKTGHHKVNVILFSNTGERAAPFMRQAARDYWAYASFAFVLWRVEDAGFWSNTFGIDSAPAIVFLKSPGVEPTVIHGAVHSSSFSDMMEQNKHQDLPQLRSITSEELGCDGRGYSRAGKDTMTWYCVIVAGRPSTELSKMRVTMLKVQDALSNDMELTSNGEEKSSNPPAAAAVALKEKRLTFTWLDGEAQKNYCFFYLQSETSYETCGPRRDINDVPQLMIVRYKRNSTMDEIKVVEKRPKTLWDQFLQEDLENHASQLVARYNGSHDVQNITQWVSETVKGGDTMDLPFFRTKSPDLVPEDSEPIWVRGAQSVVSKGNGMKQRIRDIIISMYDWMVDPRTGPVLLLGACLSFGTIWLHRNQSTRTSPSSEASMEEYPRPSKRKSTRRTSSNDQSSSANDNEPKDADQSLSSSSDSE